VHNPAHYPIGQAYFIFQKAS
jgi:hypothetical protein